MKILCPIMAPDEVEFLVANGADELYCGVVPSKWLARYTSAVWLNRRSPHKGNLPSLEALRDLVNQAGAHGVPVYLTLNSPYYTDDQYPLLLDLARVATEDIGIAALIVQDVGLITALREEMPAAHIHVSSIGVSLNPETVQFYAELGAQRVILPRSLRLPEIAAIREAVGDAVELEVFILNEGCAFEEGYCLTTHQAVGAFCAEPWEYRVVDAADDMPAGVAEEALAAHLEDYREWLYYLQGCGCTTLAGGLPSGPCGLCALPELAAIGVDSVKIVGREASPYRKLGSIQLVKAVMDWVRAGEGTATVQTYAQQIRRTPEICASGYMCYYR